MTQALPRADLLARLQEPRDWDLAVIGGGAVGLGVALDAAVRGFSVVLVEAHDFAKGTSSRATKLAHGGVRYLAQGEIGLVREALHERGAMLANAPHVAQRLRSSTLLVADRRICSMCSLMAESFSMNRSRCGT